MLAEIAPSVTGCPAVKPISAGGGEGDRDDANADADAVDNVLADEEPREVGRRPAKLEPAEHDDAALGVRGALQRLDRMGRGRIEAGVALLGEGDELAEHLRRPKAAQVGPPGVDRLRFWQGGVEIRDLVGHPDEFVDFAWSCGEASAQPVALALEDQRMVGPGQHDQSDAERAERGKAQATSARRARPALQRRRSQL